MIFHPIPKIKTEMNETEPNNNNRSSHSFELLLIFSQISAISMIATGGFIFGTIDLGFNLNWYENEAKNSSGNVNNHGILMAIGAVFLRGEALLAFRLLRHEPQQLVMVVHFAFYLLSLLLPAGGLYSIYTHKDFRGELHLKSAHSWMGAALIIANLVHLLSGCSAWLSTQKTRQVIMPKQRVFSLGLFLCTVTQLIGGISQFNQMAFSKCSPHCPIYEDLLLNFFPLCTIAYTIFVILLLKGEDWRSISLDKMAKNK